MEVLHGIAHPAVLKFEAGLQMRKFGRGAHGNSEFLWVGTRGSPRNWAAVFVFILFVGDLSLIFRKGKQGHFETYKSIRAGGFRARFTCGTLATALPVAFLFCGPGDVFFFFFFFFSFVGPSTSK